ncbi:MAG: NAD-dependent deacetylase [Campylobacterales bacterium]
MVAKKIWILSGAGLSAESGLRTFRDHDGLWEEYDVMEVCSIEGWRRDRDKVTRFYDARRAQLAHVLPNAAHYYIASLEERYPDRLINMTQNVDDLLERAGCCHVIHLHGTLTDLRCEECGSVFHIGYAHQEGFCCPKCGSARVRHNVVMFGESAPAYRHLYEAMDEAGLFIAIGTSGQVIDVGSIAERVALSVFVNPKREEEPRWGREIGWLDERFDRFIQKKATEAIDEIEEVIREFVANL